MSPMNDRCTWVTSPWPWQVEQRTGCEPSAAPAPLHRGQSTAVSTRSGLVVPNAASASSRSSRTRASWPRRIRDRGPARPRRPKLRAAGLGKANPAGAEAAVEAAHPAAERVAAAVVEVALLGVLENLVRLGDPFEPLGCVRLAGDVGVQLHRQPAVGLLDLLGARVARHPEDLVVVTAHRFCDHPSDKKRPT